MTAESGIARVVVSGRLKSIINEGAAQLEAIFPGSRGMVSVCEEQDGVLNRQTHWGGNVTCDIQMHKKNCRIVNLASRNMLGAAEEAMHCPRTDYPHMCQPLLTGEKLAGCIHLGFADLRVSEQQTQSGRTLLASLGQQVQAELEHSS